MAALLITTYREACAASGDFITGPDQTWLLGIGLLKSVASGADSLRIVRTWVHEGLDVPSILD